jgi:hypothetical protein
MKKTLILSIVRLNKIALALHLVQGVAMLALVQLLNTSKIYDVSALYLKFDQTTKALVPASTSLFDVNFAWLVAGFLFMSALAHLIIVTVYKKRYVDELQQGINRARWI